MKKKLLGMKPDELRQLAVSAGLPAFTGGQIARWMYQKGVTSTEEMTDISKRGREKLAEEYEVGRTAPAEVQRSSDGTKKYLFPVSCTLKSGLDPGETARESSMIETVMIPDGDRKTLCVSSQAGCKMGCRFCMTGRQGFHGHISAADIINQYLSVAESGVLTGTVFMGMGEPLDNWENVERVIEVLTSDWGFAWSPKRITLSTIGVIPTLRKYLDSTRCHIAISMHSPFADERQELMPLQKIYPIEEVIALLRNYDFSGQRRLSFEYTMFEGLNDDKRHADRIIRLLRGMECRVNLIHFNRIPDFPYNSPVEKKMELFRDRLSAAGITSTIRASKGEDIQAACGLLAGKHGSYS